MVFGLFLEISRKPGRKEAVVLMRELSNTVL